MAEERDCPWVMMQVGGRFSAAQHAAMSIAFGGSVLDTNDGLAAMSIALGSSRLDIGYGLAARAVE